MLMDTDLRPCHDQGCVPNACASAHYNRITYNQTALHGAWHGWRMAGRDLVSPDRQRISPERLRGLLFRQEAEERLAQLRIRKNLRSHASTKPAGELIPAREIFAGSA
jgi:hypothetical protein